MQLNPKLSKHNNGKLRYKCRNHVFSSKYSMFIVIVGIIKYTNNSFFTAVRVFFFLKSSVNEVRYSNNY